MASWRQQFATKATRFLSRWNIDGTGYVSSSGTSAGISIAGNKDLESATFFACLNLIGGTIGALGFDVYRKKKSGSSELASAHPLHEVLRWEPNRHGTAFEFWQRAVWDQERCGDAYSKITRNSQGDVLALLPLDYERVQLKTETDDWVYRYTRPSGGFDDVREEDVFHLRNFTLDGRCGISTKDLARQRLGLDLAVERYGAAFFGKGGRVKDIFKIDAVPTQEQRDKFRTVFRDAYGSADTFHEAMLLEKGMDLVGKSGATPNEAQFLETQVSNAIVLCRFLGVPPTMVGIYDRMSYNSQEQLALQFLQLCLWPRVERIEQAARRALLTADEKSKGYYIHSKIQKVLRGDMRARAEYYRTLMSLKALSANEIRDLEDMPRIEGDPEADEYRFAVNIFGPDTPEQAGAAAGADAGTEAAKQEVARAA
jgi:HK97 family phage portal protein